MSDAIGTLRSIWRFPIKSFQGQSVERVLLGESGIHADRVLALRSLETGKIVSGKQAQLGERILGFEARFLETPVPGQTLPPIEARIGDDVVRADDRERIGELCTAALGHPVELVASGSKEEVYDTYWPEIEDLPIGGAEIDFPLPLVEAGSFADLEPLHLLTTASLATLAARAPDSRIDVGRFRPSLLIETGDAEGFVENDWTGRVATLGAATLAFGDASPRCIMTTRAQAGLPKDPGVLKAIARENRKEFMGLMMPSLGVYAKVTTPGEVAVGDALRFE